MADSAMKVADLIDFLRQLPGEMPLVADYDCRCAQGAVVAAEVGLGSDDPRPSVVLVVN